jgi:type II secretory pathway component PulF
MIFTIGQLKRRAELYHQLGAMIKAGVPLIQALQMAGNNASLRASQKTISALLGHMQNGLSFSDSMTRVQGWMPDYDKALLSAGELSGKLDAGFKQLAISHEMRAAIFQDVLVSFLRTFVTIHVYLLVFPLAYLIKFVMGIMNNNYYDCIPFIRDKIVWFSGMYALIFFFIFACQGNRGEKWRAFLETIGQVLPIYRFAQKYLALARLSGTLEALVSTDMGIVKAWPTAAAASGSPELKWQVSKWGPQLESGHTPAELVSQTKYFPEMFKNLYHTGEVSGRLDESLNRLQIYFQEEGLRKLHAFIRLVNGILYTLLVARVLIAVAGFYIGYFNGIFANF